MMKEVWIPIPGYEAYYEASDQGRVRRIGGNILVETVGMRGYTKVSLSANGVKRTHNVHVLIAFTYLGPANGRLVLHRNDKKADNRLRNLRYGTGSDNAEDARINGTLRVGSKHGCATLTEVDIPVIRRLLTWGGKLPREVAAMYGVTREAISDIKNRRSWTHV